MKFVSIEYNKYQEAISDRWDVIVSLSNIDTLNVCHLLMESLLQKVRMLLISKQLISGIHEFVKKHIKKIFLKSY